MSKYNYKLETFYKEDDISFYLLGAIMTDGCIVQEKSKKKVSLVSADYDWLVLIRDIICPEKPIYTKYGAPALFFHSTELANWLISKGCSPAKSLTLQFPQVPEQYLPDFIRGCMDGDGSLGIYQTIRHKRNNLVETKIKSYLCGSSYDFLNGFSQTLNTLGIKNSFHEMKGPTLSKIGDRTIVRSNKHWRVEMAIKSTAKLVSLAYYAGHRISMPRKNLIAQSIIATAASPTARATATTTTRRTATITTTSA